nr:MAG: RNA-dependent RNA polymerase [Sanya phasmavirus 2]
MDPKLRRIFDYRGRRDRIIDENERIRDLRPLPEAFRPRNEADCGFKKLVDSITDRVKAGVKVSVTTAASDYAALMEVRHQIWVQLLDDVIIKRYEGQKVTETSFGDFCNSISITIRDPEVYKKKPDILYVSKQDNIVVMSDVAVTKQDVSSLNNVKSRKYKYCASLIEKNSHYKVVWIPAIIASSADNGLLVLNTWKKRGEVGDFYRNLNNVTRRTEIINQSMNMVLETCDDPRQVVAMISDNQSKFDRIDIELPPGCAPIAVEKPLVDELTIGKWVKEVTDKEMLEGYFDTDYSETKNAFTKLREMYKYKTDSDGNIVKDDSGNPTVKECMAPKSTLKVIAQTEYIEEKSGHELLRDYIEDIHDATTGNSNDVAGHALNLLPTLNQLRIMQNFKSNPPTLEVSRDSRVFGEYQFEFRPNLGNTITSQMRSQLSKGKKNPNEKWTPLSTNPDEWESQAEFIESSMLHLGQLSNKKSFLSDEWDTATGFEEQCTDFERKQYEYVKCTNGAQLCQSLSNLYQRLMHMSTSKGMRDNIYIPPNGAFIAVIPKEHAPISHKSCSLPMVFLTRTRLGEEIHYEYEHRFDTNQHTYFVSKLCRLDISKLESWDQAGYKMVACVSYLLGRCRPLVQCREKLVGIITYFMLDNHQKTSEYLDLLKYVSFMPFSDIHRLSKLVLDKFSIIMKTRLNSWTLLKLESFMEELSIKERIGAKKPKIVISGGMMTRESFGMSMTLPSFCDHTVRHNSAESYIEEVTMLNIVRPKHLYGSQFMDKALTDTARWNNDYLNEVEKHGDWLITGRGEDGSPYPFDAKFSFCRDAIIHALEFSRMHDPINPGKLTRNLSRSSYTDFMHYQCSLRGCTKEVSDRKTPNDYHTTSMESCLNYYKRMNYDDDKCRVSSVAVDFLKTNDRMSFSMSEKDQRGGGRPISTPTLGTKAVLMMIEKPEQEIGKLSKNNILVEGKNKLKEQSETYKSLVTSASLEGFTQIYQLTEDQTKFSENDNTRKFIPYVNNNTILDKRTRQFQLEGLAKLVDREHLVHRQPRAIEDDQTLHVYKLKDNFGCKAIIGWPQGMLNNMSTSIHSIADVWITHLYNTMYPRNQVRAKGLVHSDDSWVTVACNDLNDFKRYSIFRKVAKKLFCLKLNEKKLWGSRYLGELVSNYNINGNVHLPVSKTIANSLTNIMYQNWVIDAHNQVSSLQQAYRSGANMPTIILMKTILRQQLVDSYVVKGLHRKLISLLPIELGGFPSESAFELAVNGVNCHYMHLAEHYAINPDSQESKICINAVMMSVERNKSQNANPAVKMVEQPKTSTKYASRKGNEINEEDFEMTGVAHKGDIFTAVRHLLPKTHKMAKTVSAIKDIPFPPSNLEMVVTRPKLLKDSLGNLVSQTSTMLYDLAADHYTQNTRRLAVSQVVQSTGKVIKLGDNKPCTFNEMYDILLNGPEYEGDWHETLKIAFDDDTVVPGICSSIIRHSDYNPIITDHRKIINRMPSVDDNYKTQCKLQHVLLKIIDDARSTPEHLSTLLIEHCTETEDDDLLKQDAENLKKRFKCYFSVYTAEYACNLIMRQFLLRTKSRLFMQPYLKNETEVTFLCDLYGKTVCSTQSFSVRIDYTIKGTKTRSDTRIESLYTIAVLNSVYEGKFEAKYILNRPVPEVIMGIDYANVSYDELLKLCILRRVHCNDDTLFEYYSKNRRYSQQWYQMQLWHPERKDYVGPYDLVCSSGNDILRITNRGIGVYIECNTTNVTNILILLNRFVMTNFKNWSYFNIHDWANCEKLQGAPIGSTLYLSRHRGRLTQIGASRAPQSIPFRLNETMAGPLTETVESRHEIVLKENLRTAHALIDGVDVKFGAAKQTLKCPMANQIVLKPSSIDRIVNQDLIKNNLITSIVRGAYDNNEIADYKNALYGSITGKPVDPVVGFIAGVCELVLGSKSAFRFDLNDMPDIECVNIVVEDITPNAMFSKMEASSHLMTDPEDCTHLQFDEIMPEATFKKHLVPVYNIRRACARAIHNTIGAGVVTEILTLSLSDTRVRKLLGELISSANVGPDGFELPELDLMIESVEECEVDEVYGLILAFGLDKPQQLRKYISQQSLRNRTLIPSYRESAQFASKFIKELIRVMSYTYVSEEVDPLENLFDKGVNG